MKETKRNLDNIHILQLINKKNQKPIQYTDVGMSFKNTTPYNNSRYQN
jgi:hypothetical protein